MKKPILRNALTTSFLFSVLLAGNASANLLINGGFEDQPSWGSSNGTGCGTGLDSNCSALTGAQLPGWTVETGHAVTIHNAGVYPTISGLYSVNTDGEGYNRQNGNFYQDFASIAGQQLELKYDWRTWYANTSPNLFISVIDTLTGASLYSGNLVWTSGLHQEDALFLGTGDVLRLRIEELPQTGFNDNSYIVDNFSVTARDMPPIDVPEPASLKLLGLAMAGLAFSRGQKKR